MLLLNRIREYQFRFQLEESSGTRGHRGSDPLSAMHEGAIMDCKSRPALTKPYNGHTILKYIRACVHNASSYILPVFIFTTLHQQHLRHDHHCHHYDRRRRGPPLPPPPSPKALRVQQKTQTTGPPMRAAFMRAALCQSSRTLPHLSPLTIDTTGSE